MYQEKEEEAAEARKLAKNGKKEAPVVHDVEKRQEENVLSETSTTPNEELNVNLIDPEGALKQEVKKFY